MSHTILAQRVMLCLPLLAQGAYNPSNNLLGNSDFEAGPANWVAGGGGIAAVETCCGQHETPFWGKNPSPYPAGSQPAFDNDTRDGYIEPNGQTTRLMQSRAVTAGQKYRISTWFWDNGMVGRLYFRSPSTGKTFCGTSSGLFAPLSCEFTAPANEQMTFGLEGNGAVDLWVVSDDWALTPITKPARNNAPTWNPLPVLYYGDANSYQTRTDIAAATWNNAMGKQMLKRTSDQNQAKILVVGRNLGTVGPYANWYNPSPPNQPWGVVEINRDYLDVWKDPPYRFGFEAREGIIAHEFGHALGMKHVDEVGNNCQLMQRFGHIQTWRCAVYKPTSPEIEAVRAIYP